jgi:hypothetical protein
MPSLGSKNSLLALARCHTAVTTADWRAGGDQWGQWLPSHRRVWLKEKGKCDSFGEKENTYTSAGGRSLGTTITAGGLSRTCVDTRFAAALEHDLHLDDGTSSPITCCLQQVN